MTEKSDEQRAGEFAKDHFKSNHPAGGNLRDIAIEAYLAGLKEGRRLERERLVGPLPQVKKVECGRCKWCGLQVGGEDPEKYTCTCGGKFREITKL